VTSKVRVMCDALGNMVDSELLAGPRHDTVGVAALIVGWEFDGFIGDKAFDAGRIIEELERRGADIVMSQHPNRTMPSDIDKEIYKWRHLVENCIGKLKEFKRIAMRACKTDTSFAAMIQVADAVINSRESQRTLAGGIGIPLFPPTRPMPLILLEGSDLNELCNLSRLFGAHPLPLIGGTDPIAPWGRCQLLPWVHLERSRSRWSGFA